METDQVLELSLEFAALGADLHGDGDNDTALRRIVELAVKHVPGCSRASIIVITQGRGRSLACSDPVAAAIDKVQHDLGEGPCLQAAADNEDHLLFDVATETRWPRYTRALIERSPVRSVLSLQLQAEDAAALNLFADTAGAFHDDAIDIASILAAHASSLVALYESENRAAHLNIALHSSRQIGAAIGILMTHRKVTEEQAFTLLRVASQSLHRKLRDVAEDVVETGALPEVPEPQHKVAE